MKRAWLITITTWPRLPELIIYAETSGKARYAAWLDSRDAGWDIPYIEFRAKLYKKGVRV